MICCIVNCQNNYNLSQREIALVVDLGTIAIRKCRSLKIAAKGDYPVSMDQIAIKTPNPKCRLYWCLIDFIDWRQSQSCWYFRPLF